MNSKFRNKFSLLLLSRKLFETNADNKFIESIISILKLKPIELGTWIDQAQKNMPMQSSSSSSLKITCLCLETFLSMANWVSGFFLHFMFCFCIFGSLARSQQINNTAWNAVNWIRWAQTSVMYASHSHHIFVWYVEHKHMRTTSRPSPSKIHWPR